MSGPKLVEFPKPPEGDTWSPLEMLEKIIAKIKSGEAKPVNLVVAYFEDDGDAIIPTTWVCNMAHSEQVGLLELLKQKALERWREPD